VVRAHVHALCAQCVWAPWLCLKPFHPSVLLPWLCSTRTSFGGDVYEILTTLLCKGDEVRVWGAALSP
jgi:hypothetical protein